MYSLLTKKYYFFIYLVPAIIAAGLLFILPVSQKIHDYVTLYRQAFVEPFPNMLLHTGKIEFLDPVPVTITIGDAVEIICDSIPDTTYFSSCAQNSVLISKFFIFTKSREKVNKIDLADMNITDDPIHISPVKISNFIDKYSVKILKIGAILSIFIVYILFVIIAFLGSGVGVMIDAFSKSKLNYLPLLNISSLVLSIYTIINCILYSLHIIQFKDFYWLTGLFFLIIAILVYVLEQSAISTYLNTDERL